MECKVVLGAKIVATFYQVAIIVANTVSGGAGGGEGVLVLRAPSVLDI